MIKRRGIVLAVAALVTLSGCSAPEIVADPTAIEVEQAAVQIKILRQGDYLTEVKKLLSSENGQNDIQLLAAGYEACLTVTESNKDSYREKVMTGAESIESGLDQLVIAAGAKAILCP